MTDTLDPMAGSGTPPRIVDAPLGPPSADQGLVGVFKRRYLLRLLVRREISARYQGSFLGLLWSYLNPLSQFFIYFFIIGTIFDLHDSIENFAIHIFCGAGHRPLLQRDAERRHALDRPQQGAGAEARHAAGDVPGRLHAGLALPRRCRSW